MGDTAAASDGHGLTVGRAFAALASSHLLRTFAGFVFWVVVARLAPTSAVGLAGAVVASVTLLSPFTSLGLSSFLMAELPRMPAAAGRELFRVGSAVLVVVTLVTGLLWCGAGLLLGGDGGSSLGASVGSAGVAALFVAILVLTTVGFSWDDAALGLDRSGAQVTRNLVAALGRFPVLLAWPAVVGDVDAVAVLVAWVVPLAVSLVVFALQTRVLAGSRTAPARARQLLATHWSTSLGHYFLDVSLGAGPLLVPVIAAAVLAPRDNGWFTVAWMAASVVFVAPFALATSMFASHAARGSAAFLRSCRRALPVGLGLAAGGCLGTWLLGPLVFRLFGADYVEASLPLMSVLVLGGFWMVVKDLLLDWLRLDRRFVLGTALALGATAGDVVGALVGGLVLGGGHGVAVGWVVASAGQALLASPLVVDFIRRIVGAPAEV